MAQVVRRLGHDVTVVGDGQAALEAAAQRRPDLVIADVDMPRLNGLDMCRAIRDDPALSDVPVVLVTALLAPTDPDLTTCGVTSVVRKPFAVQELTDAIQAQLPAEGADARAQAPSVAGSTFTEALLQSLDIGVVACDATGRL